MRDRQEIEASGRLTDEEWQDLETGRAVRSLRPDARLTRHLTRGMFGPRAESFSVEFTASDGTRHGYDALSALEAIQGFEALVAERREAFQNRLESLLKGTG